MSTMIIKMNEHGVALLAKGEAAVAEKVFENCITYNPGFLPAFYNRGAARLAQGRITEALEDLDYYISNSGDPNGYVVKGDIAMAMSDYAEAERCYSICLRETPNPAIYYRRFVARVQAGDLHGGYEDLQEAGRFGDKDALALLTKMRKEVNNV